MTFTIKARHLVIAALVALFGILAACSSPPQGNTAENTDQQTIQANFVKNQPPPNDAYSQYRQNLIEWQHEQNTGEATTSFFMKLGSPDPFLICPSIGYPIPNTSSLTNPEQITWIAGSSNYYSGVVQQMDPNGVYAPNSSSGTLVMCVGPDGKPQPVYAEDAVEVAAGAATWDSGAHRMVLAGGVKGHYTTHKGG